MAATMLMRVGGPKGRDAVVMVKTNHLDAKSQAFHQRILAGAKAESFEDLAEAIKEFDSVDTVFDDVELSKRLDKYAESGMDREINASNVLTSRCQRGSARSTETNPFANTLAIESACP